METVTSFIFLGSKITENCDCSPEIKRHLLLGRKAVTNLDRVLKSRDITLPTKVCIVKTIVFSSSHLGMLELDCKEGWLQKNWCFQIAGLEKTLESSLDCKENKPVDPKGNQPWIFIICTDCWSPSILPIWCEELTHWKRPWCCERLRAGEVGNRGRNGWMASWAQWTWIWANSGN